jgi:RIO kinase 1
VTGDTPFDRYDSYEDLYARRWGDRREAVRTKPKYATLSERMRDQVVAELTDGAADLEGGFCPTYKPSRHEQGWLLSSLRSFYDQGLISDVLARVKGGKEANVYLCRGPEQQDRRAGGVAAPDGRAAPVYRLLAAKVYRPRMFRNLRNDALYRQGRDVMVAGGKAAGKAAGTIARAIRNKSAFGMEAAHVSWLMHEYAALDMLYRAGAPVPQPVAANENCVLMGYCGDEREAAPTLHGVDLDPVEAFDLYHKTMGAIEIVLRHGLVHGDLSAYNVLYWEGEITVIDFPQVVNLHANQDARWILRRDVERICDYFQLQGLRCDARAQADDLWARCSGEPEEAEPEVAEGDWYLADGEWQMDDAGWPTFPLPSR